MSEGSNMENIWWEEWGIKDITEREKSKTTEKCDVRNVLLAAPTTLLWITWMKRKSVLFRITFFKKKKNSNYALGAHTFKDPKIIEPESEIIFSSLQSDFLSKWCTYATCVFWACRLVTHHSALYTGWVIPVTTAQMSGNTLHKNNYSRKMKGWKPQVECHGSLPLRK